MEDEEDYQYSIEAIIPFNTVSKLHKCFKSGPFSSSKLTLNSNPLTQLTFEQDSNVIFLKIKFEISYLIIQIPVEQMTMPLNMKEASFLIYFQDLANCLFSLFVLNDGSEVHVAIDMEKAEFIVRDWNFYSEDLYEFYFNKANLINPEVDQEFPNLEKSDWSFVIRGKTVKDFIFTIDYYAKMEEREYNFFEIYLKNKESIDIARVDNFNHQIKSTFQIDLVQTSDSFLFGDHYTYGTCDFNLFLSSFSQGPDEIFFYFLKDGRMIIDRSLIKDLPDFRVKQQFNPIINK